MQLHACIWKGLIEQTTTNQHLVTHYVVEYCICMTGKICAKVFWWCVLNSLAPANHTQPFIADMLILSCCACADAIKLTRPLCRLMLICVTNQSSDLLRPLTVRNSDLNNQAIGGKSNPIRQGILTQALRFAQIGFMHLRWKRGESLFANVACQPDLKFL